MFYTRFSGECFTFLILYNFCIIADVPLGLILQILYLHECNEQKLRGTIHRIIKYLNSTKRFYQFVSIHHCDLFN